MLLHRMKRGSQLSIRVTNGDKNLFDKITKKGGVSDWREPDVIRVIVCTIIQ